MFNEGLPFNTSRVSVLTVGNNQVWHEHRDKKTITSERYVVIEWEEARWTLSTCPCTFIVQCNNYSDIRWHNTKHQWEQYNINALFIISVIALHGTYSGSSSTILSSCAYLHVVPNLYTSFFFRFYKCIFILGLFWVFN